MRLQQAWLGRGALAWGLRPLAGFYGSLAAVHRSLYTLGIRHTERLPVPVVVVGNVVAGGAGKTPVVMAVVQHLQSRGLQPGVISRGYGRTGDTPSLEVRPDDDPRAAGDEPLLLARRCGVPVVVGARRAQAGRHLLARHPQVQVLVSDDGLQHRALARDIEICVFDARGIGNGWLLPAGPLREPWPRRADLVLRPAGVAGVEGFEVRRRLAPEAVRADGTRRSLADLARGPLTAVAGIAQPEAFFDMLRGAGIVPAHTLALADHHDYALHPVSLPADLPVVCTEKDAVKLWRLRPDAWAVPLQVEIDPAFWPAFDRLLDAKLSSVDGSQTA
ncbi:MAG: putative Tetraacyldisaccharide 4-kinase [Pseudomonadota bacterium]